MQKCVIVVESEVADSMYPQIKEVLSVPIKMPFQQRNAFDSALNELYKIQHKTKGMFVGEKEYAVATETGLYYLAYEGIGSRANEITYDESEFKEWKLWYLKSQILQLFQFTNVGIFTLVSLKEKTQCQNLITCFPSPPKWSCPNILPITLPNAA
jgi:hypothetical protein